MDPAAVARRAITEHGALQKPGELAELLALLEWERPRLVLEIGADAGGTLWAWRQLGAEVVAVDLPGGPFSTGRPRVDHGATVLEGDSHDKATWKRVRAQLGWQPRYLRRRCGVPGMREVDVLFIDADHRYEGCRQDVQWYRPFLRTGGLLVLHDICHHPGQPEVGVDRVWAELKGRRRRGVMEIVHEPATWGGLGVLRR